MVVGVGPNNKRCLKWGGGGHYIIIHKTACRKSWVKVRIVCRDGI